MNESAQGRASIAPKRSNVKNNDPSLIEPIAAG